MPETRAETPKDFMPQLDSPSADVSMEDFRYRGYLNSITMQDPRYPLTGPIGYKGDTKTYPLKSSLIKGLPVLPPKPAEGFVHGSPNVKSFTEDERRERRFNLKLLEKSSADLRKIQMQQSERQKFMEEYQRKKNAEGMLKKQEKEEDLKLLKTYNPFGKPGFGAPRGSGRQHAKMTKALEAKDGVGIVRIETKPLSESVNYPADRPKLQRYEDDRMRRYKVDKETAEKYRRELDALVDVKSQKQKLIEDLDRKREDGMAGYDPFGKPGAGAPNRDEKGNIKMSRKHHFSSPEKFTPSEEDNAQNPWLKLGQPPAKREKHYPRVGDHGIYEFVDPNAENDVISSRHFGGGGEPLMGDNGEVKTKRVGLLQTIHGARRTENVTKVATPEEVRRQNDRNSPWGKPGAGAPLTDNDGEIVKNTKGRIQHEALGYSRAEEETMERAKKIYRNELMDGIDRQKHIRDEEKAYLRLPPGDVPSWFSKGKVGRPKRDPLTGIIVPQKRIMSDVTAQKFHENRPRDAEKYYQDLQHMANERYKKRLEEKQRILQQEIKMGTSSIVKSSTMESVMNVDGQTNTNHPAERLQQKSMPENHSGNIKNSQDKLFDESKVENIGNKSDDEIRVKKSKSSSSAERQPSEDSFVELKSVKSLPLDFHHIGFSSENCINFESESKSKENNLIVSEETSKLSEVTNHCRVVNEVCGCRLEKLQNRD